MPLLSGLDLTQKSFMKKGTEEKYLDEAQNIFLSGQNLKQNTIAISVMLEPNWLLLIKA